MLDTLNDPRTVDVPPTVEQFARRCFVEFRAAIGRPPVEPVLRLPDYYTLPYTRRPYLEAERDAGCIMTSAMVSVDGVGVPLSIHVRRIAVKHRLGDIDQAINDGVQALTERAPNVFAPMAVPGGVFHACLVTAPMDDFCVRIVAAYDIMRDDLIYRYDVLGGTK